MDRQNKKSSCARKSGRKQNNAGIDKEDEKKLAGPLAKKELPAEGCSRRWSCLLKDALEGMANGKKVRGRRRYQMIDNITINGLHEDTKWKAEKRVEWRMLSLQ